MPAKGCIGLSNDPCDAACRAAEVARWKYSIPSGYYNILMDLDLPIRSPDSIPYVYRIITKRLCFTDAVSNWFDLESGKSCFNMTNWGIPNRPGGDGWSKEYCDIPAYDCNVRYDWDECGDAGPMDHDFDRINCLFPDQTYPVQTPCAGGTCPSPADFINLITRRRDLEIVDINCTSDIACYAVANKIVNSEEKGAFILATYDGQNWSAKAMPLQAAYRVKRASVGEAAWVIGKSASSDSVIIKTADGGRTWSTQSVEDLGKAFESLDILEDGPNTYGIIGPSSSFNSAGLLFTQDGGTSLWRKELVFGTNAETNNFFAASNSLIDIDLYQSGKAVAGSNVLTVYHLQYNPVTKVWDTTGQRLPCQTGGSSKVERVRMVSDNLGFAAGAGGCAAKFDGTAWQKIEGIPNTVNFYGLDAENSLQAFAGNDGKVYIIDSGNPAEVRQLPHD